MLQCTYNLRTLAWLFPLLLSWGCNGAQKELPVQSAGDFGRIRTGTTASFADSLAALPAEERVAAASQFISRHPVTPVIESDSIFSLYWFGNAARVLVSGDLQSGWSVPDTMAETDCGENRFFHISYKVPPDARLDYRLRVDSTEMTDPRNPVVTPSGYGPHSQVAMPGFTPNPIRMDRRKTAKGSFHWIPFISSNQKVASRNLKVYLPAGYENLTRLPVIFILDGLEALDYMNYNTVLDNLVADGRIVPVIAVFIPPGNRMTENLGEESVHFVHVICDELVPVIDRAFKTDPQPASRAISGISSGGHLALLTVLTRPDVFLNGAGQSPTLSETLFEALGEFPGKFESILQPENRKTAGGADPGQNTGHRERAPGSMTAGKETAEIPKFTTRIYFDVGRFDLPQGTAGDQSFLEAATLLHQELDQKGIGHLFRIVNDGHEWASWRERTDQVLVCFFEHPNINNL
jgi:enterochelin esterase-like enzyme